MACSLHQTQLRPLSPWRDPKGKTSRSTAEPAPARALCSPKSTSSSRMQVRAGLSPPTGLGAERGPCLRSVPTASRPCSGWAPRRSPGRGHYLPLDALLLQAQLLLLDSQRRALLPPASDTLKTTPQKVPARSSTRPTLGYPPLASVAQILDTLLPRPSVEARKRRPGQDPAHSGGVIGNKEPWNLEGAPETVGVSPGNGLRGRRWKPAKQGIERKERVEPWTGRQKPGSSTEPRTQIICRRWCGAHPGLLWEWLSP